MKKSLVWFCLFLCAVLFADNVCAEEVQSSAGRNFYIRAESGVVAPVAKV